MRHTFEGPKNKGDSKVPKGKSTGVVRHTRLPGPAFQIFDPESKNYVEAKAHRWPVSNEITWVENTLAERKALESPKLSEDEKQHLGLKGTLAEYRMNPPATRDLEIWLSKVRDEESWNGIARKQYLSYNKSPSAARSSVIRAYERVEKYLVRIQNPKSATGTKTRAGKSHESPS